MRIIVTGGGTGGHVFPAIEIAQEIKKQNNKIEVIFAGNKNSLEEKIAKSYNILFLGLPTKKIIGQSFFNKILAFIYLKLAILKSMRFILKYRPNAIIGVGGYVSAPMVIAGYLLRVKRYICEQNVVPGFANQKLGFIANQVFISFEESRQYFSKKKCFLSGNPVRQEFFLLPQKTPNSTLRILITGGSLGARFLNHEVPIILAELYKEFPTIQVTHQTGKALVEPVLGLYQRSGIRANVVSFIDNMAEAFSNHDLLISRAGATVCAEILVAAMPAILIPYPFANGHQKHNAKAMVSRQAAIMIEEGHDFRAKLFSTLKAICNEPAKLNDLSHHAKAIEYPKAAFTIVNHVLNDKS